MIRRLAPSVLNADLAQLADQVRLVEEAADWIHLDLMDGHFVPNLTFGPPVVAALRPHTGRYLDCHLMVANPEALLPALAEAGANGVSLHIEALDDPARAVRAAARHGLEAGLALKPGTPLEQVLPYLDTLDLVLPMTVEPGFGGQAFDDRVLPKIAAAHRAIAERGRPVALQVDGGINADTLPRCLAAGADAFVVGTAIFHADDPAAAHRAIAESGRPVALQVDGGINADSLPRCLAAGADAFVVGTAIFHADDPAAAAKAFREVIHGGAGGLEERSGSSPPAGDGGAG